MILVPGKAATWGSPTRPVAAAGPLERRFSDMRISDLIKATLVCGGMAFLVYSFPVLGQVVIIAVLSALWASCAHQTIRKVFQR